MIRTRFKKVLLVAPNDVADRLLTDYKNVKQVTAVNAVFPAIFESQPDIIVFDCDFMGKEMENTLRRLKINKFYNRIKICGFKSAPNSKIDSLLKVLGVDQMLYLEDLNKQHKVNPVIEGINTIVDASILKLVASVSN
jgi:hypothetical protein